MANRAMAAKAARAKREAREAAFREFSKAAYLVAKPTIPAYDEAMVRRIPAARKVERRTYTPAPRPAPALMAAWAVGDYGLIRR